MKLKLDMRTMVNACPAAGEWILLRAILTLETRRQSRLLPFFAGIIPTAFANKAGLVDIQDHHMSSRPDMSGDGGRHDANGAGAGDEEILANCRTDRLVLYRLRAGSPQIT